MNKNSQKKISILFTIFSILFIILFIRLGFWQLERLEWRRDFNDHYLEQINLPELNLNINQDIDLLMLSEYRKVFVSGKFDFSEEVFLQNQVYQNQPGYHVLTPFLIDGHDEAVLVDRGWISLNDLDQIKKIDQFSNSIHQINGVIRLGESKNSFGSNFNNIESDPNFMLLVDIEQIKNKISYDLLPVYIQIENKVVEELPIPQIAEVEITEGPHMGYAIQWFFFASVVGVGYPLFIRKLKK